MKITFIKPFKSKKNNVMMKHLREDEYQSKKKLLKKITELNTKMISYIKEKNITQINKKGKGISQNINVDKSNANNYNIEQNSKHKEQHEKVVNAKRKVNKNGKELILKKVLKKNQIALFATSLMLITAGYLNYSNNIKMAALGDAKLVSANVTETNTAELNESTVASSVTETNSNIDTNSTTEESQNQENNENSLNNDQAIETNAKESKENKGDEKNDYFVQSKLDRNTMFSQMIETYEKILANEQIPNDQKSIAANEIKNINDRKSAISSIENLLKTKDLDETLVLINDSSVDVVVKSKENLEQEKVAQILNIVSRELNQPAENIHISIYN